MNSIINIFAKESGWIARIIASTIVGGIIGFLAKYGFNVSNEDNIKITGFATAIVLSIINEYISKVQASNISTVQENLKKVIPNVVIDGHAGQQTVEASKQVSTLAQ